MFFFFFFFFFFLFLSSQSCLKILTFTVKINSFQLFWSLSNTQRSKHWKRKSLTIELRSIVVIFGISGSEFLVLNSCKAHKSWHNDKVFFVCLFVTQTKLLSFKDYVTFEQPPFWKMIFPYSISIIHVERLPYRSH